MAIQLSEGIIVLGISQLIAFATFSLKIFWNYKKELGKLQQQLDELNEDLDNVARKVRENQYYNNHYIGHLQNFLSCSSSYKPPTTEIRNQWKEPP